MGTTQRILFDGGTQDAAITAATQPGFTPQGVTGGAGPQNTVTYDAAMAATGTAGAKFVSRGSANGGNASGASGRIALVEQGTTLSFKGVWTVPAALPVSGQDAGIWTGRSTTARIALMNCTYQGLTFLDKGNVFNNPVTAAQIAPYLGQKLTVAIILIGATTTTGRAIVKIYRKSDGVQVGTTIDRSDLNLDTVNFVASDVGVSGDRVLTDGWDDLQYNVGLTTELPDYVVTTNASAGADLIEIEPYTTVTLTATDDATGSPARAWTQISGSPTVTLTQNGKTATFTAPGTLAGTTLGFRYTVNGVTDDMTVAVMAATERAVIGGVEVPMQMISVSST